LFQPELQKTVDAAGISAVVYYLCLLTFSVVHVVAVCLACKNSVRTGIELISSVLGFQLMKGTAASGEPV
jgi:hypothetical protein